MSNMLTTFRKAYHTPWQDFLLCKISNRLDWKLALRQSGLQQEIQEAITIVVLNARLTLRERASVTNELIAHFLDGQDAGHTPDELLEKFGDLNVAANLIQLGKERNRSMFTRMAKITGWTTLAGFILLIAFWFYFTSLKSNPNTDYLAPLNEPIRIADESQKAWPLYRDAWIAHRFCDVANHQNYMSILTDQETGVYLKPGDEGWEAVETLLDDKQDLLDAFRKGRNRELLGLVLHSSIEEYSRLDQQALFPVHFDRISKNKESATESANKPEVDSQSDNKPKGMVIGTLMQHIHQLKVAADLLRIDSRRAANDQESERVVVNIETTFALSKQSSDSPFIISWLNGAAIAESAMDQVQEILTEAPEMLTDVQLSSLQNLVNDFDTRGLVKFGGEQASFRDIVQYLYTDDGNGEGRLTKKGLESMTGFRSEGEKVNIAWLAYNGLASRKETVDSFVRYTAQMQKDFHTPFHVNPTLNENLLQETLAETSGNKPLIETFASSSTAGLRFRLQTVLARQECTAMAIAMERFKRKSGTYPESLDLLVPEYIRSIPIDRVTGKQLKYELRNGSPLIYSVGLDRNDDGGIPLKKPSGQPTDFYFDSGTENLPTGDWILWPKENINF